MSYTLHHPYAGHELEPRQVRRLDLLDYVVLETLQQWSEIWSEKRLRRTDPYEQSTLISSMLIIVSAELVHEGYPLELALHFDDVTRPAQELARSGALEAALSFLRDRGYVVVTDAEAPHYEITSEGATLLRRARGTAADLSAILIHRAPAELFQVYDMLQRSAPRRPARELADIIRDTVRDFVGRPAGDFRLALVDLALRWILYSDAPRSYRFHASYGQLARGQSPFGGRLAGHLRRR